MWSGGKETNEHGESVLLLQPVGKRRKAATSASSSYIGGLPVYFNDEHQSLLNDDSLKSFNPKCCKCDEQMYLLLQLNAPVDDLDRTMYVFSCNNPSCHLIEEKYGDEIAKARFRPNFGGTRGGSVRCFRSQQLKHQQKQRIQKETPPPEAKVQKSQSLADNDWGMDFDCDSDDDNGWGDNFEADSKTDNTISMNDLERMLVDCEMQSTQAAKVSAKSSAPEAKKDEQAKEMQSAISGPSFEHLDLEMIDEPVGKALNDSSDDENDEDDLGANNVDSSKVDSMLSRYLEMEDDEDIIAALKGGSNATSSTNVGGSGSGGEKYERLKPEEKAFMLFSKRLRRAPEQVCRYAYGGEPLWSIPLPNKTNGRGKHQKVKKNAKTITAPFPSIPKCSCGSERVFEFQLLPNILSILDVDSANSNEDDGNDITNLNSIGGMNWGSIAVYSCPESCDESREEFLIVQESGEDVAMKPKTEPMSEEEDDS